MSDEVLPYHISNAPIARKMIRIGRYQSDNVLFLAPMAGVTDLPFRQLCKQHGAGWVVSEMVWSHKHLYETTKTQRRIDHGSEISPKIIQIAGGDPKILAESAIYNMNQGAEIIDINMGCPAKKVCNKFAGSALMKDERLVGRILKTVVSAVNIPVTLKIRTGWHSDQKNAFNIAKIAQEEGVSLLTIHGRTRDQKYTGQAEYETIAYIKDRVRIPVIANGDINSPKKAKFVLDITKADGIMIGRAAHGNPWIFSQINAYLKTGVYKIVPPRYKQKIIIVDHIKALHRFYGNQMGVRFARKHIGWYFEKLNINHKKTQLFNRIQSEDGQISFILEAVQ